MKKMAGFTLIEVVMFIVISAILANVILFSFTNALKGPPILEQQIIANQLAQKCMEGYLEARMISGYSAIATGTSVPSYCPTVTGFTVAVNAANVTINGDSNYISITATVSGNANASLTTLVADY
jgi:type II secretory pathway pseudopilin PulG